LSGKEGWDLGGCCWGGDEYDEDALFMVDGIVVCVSSGVNSGGVVVVVIMFYL